MKSFTQNTTFHCTFFRIIEIEFLVFKLEFIFLTFSLSVFSKFLFSALKDIFYKYIVHNFAPIYFPVIKYDHLFIDWYEICIDVRSYGFLVSQWEKPILRTKKSMKWPNLVYTRTSFCFLENCSAKNCFRMCRM